MVATEQIRSQLKDLSRYGSGLVGVFVGGTSGIGESTAREFVRYTSKPRIYLVGRSQDAADKLSKEFKEINTGSNVNFIKGDMTLLRSVDEVCKEIKAKEDKINLLFMTQGHFKLGGREETTEGLDQKLSLHYYSRLRFTQQLLPLLSKAANSPAEPGKQPLARVFSILGAGIEKPVNLDDFDLKKTFSISNCANHGITGTTLSFNTLAADPSNKGIEFIHSAPGGVPTNVHRNLPGPAKWLLEKGFFLLKPWTTELPESGERHAWAATTDEFRGKGSIGINAKSDVVKGSNVDGLVKDGTQAKVWEHTMEVFKKICDKGGKY